MHCGIHFHNGKDSLPVQDPRENLVPWPGTPQKMFPIGCLLWYRLATEYKRYQAIQEFQRHKSTPTCFVLAGGGPPSTPNQLLAVFRGRFQALFAPEAWGKPDPSLATSFDRRRRFALQYLVVSLRVHLEKFWKRVSNSQERFSFQVRSHHLSLTFSIDTMKDDECLDTMNLQVTQCCCTRVLSSRQGRCLS